MFRNLVKVVAGGTAFMGANYVTQAAITENINPEGRKQEILAAIGTGALGGVAGGAACVSACETVDTFADFFDTLRESRRINKQAKKLNKEAAERAAAANA